MPLNKVSSQPVTYGQGSLQVHLVSRPKLPQVGVMQGLRHNINGELFPFHNCYSQAGTIYGYTVTWLKVF